MQKLITALLFPVIAAVLTINGAYLSGKITDENNEPLIGAVIKLVSKDTSISLISDIDGNYKLWLPEGDYRMEVTYNGFNPWSMPELKITGRDIENNIKMTAPEIKTDEIDDVAFKVPLIKQDQTATGTTLTSEQIKNLPTRNINAIVTGTPGNSAIDGGAVTIEGSRANANHYYVDGVRVMGAQPAAAGKSHEKKKNGATYDTRSRGNAIMSNTSVNATVRSMPVVTATEKERRYDNGIQHDSVVPESSSEQYNKIVENPFVQVKDQAFSTFSIDVDAASYSNVRRFINSGQKPPADAVRVEEMINYFDYQYPQPTGRDPIRIITELGKCPWNAEHHLLMVGLQGRALELQQAPPSNLVFLVDVSGSMGSPDKLPLVQQSLHLLLNELRPTDRVALVTYAGNTGVALASTPASDKAAIKAAIDQLGAGGGTAGAAGITLAYQTARSNFMQQGNNRVILCTDGDFNVGLSSEKELVDMIEKERKSGVYLTVLGFGRGNYQDGKMQELADRGNGNHAYIDQIGEAKKVLVKEFSGTLFTIAKDVKLQLEFNPDQVSSYRLIGYENRMLAKEDFDNDAKDAGELGANHTVTALYEIVPNVQSNGAGDLVKLKFRYKPPTGEQSSLLVEQTVPAVCAAKMSDNFNFASSVAEFGLLLRNSTYKGTANWEEVVRNASNGLTNDKEGYRAEFVKLATQAMKY